MARKYVRKQCESMYRSIALRVWVRCQLCKGHKHPLHRAGQFLNEGLQAVNPHGEFLLQWDSYVAAKQAARAAKKAAMEAAKKEQ